MWRRCYNEKRLDEIILPGLKGQMDPRSVKLFSAIAHRCIRRAREERPTMAEIVKQLELSLEQQEVYENTPQSSRNDHRLKFESSIRRYVYYDNRTNNTHQDQADDDYSDQPPPVIDGDDSYDSEDSEGGPGIRGFQIVGEQNQDWVRHYGDGTREYIDGATNPEYVVTADDVGQLIAVECIPMDDRGRQGEILRLFANSQKKITCDPEMQQEIDNNISAGQALFSVLLLMDSSESWVQTTFSLTLFKYQIIINGMLDIFMDEKYSRDLSIKIPVGSPPQFSLAHPSGSSHAFRFHDFRTRDTFVLTMRMFQSKVFC
ncbi:hypothetical protein M8C21_026373 [Ambrosia artemisiifolia]|uniref:AIR9-like A9 domain-containing protein n=1 Tax=Ambrosia artemisiifolia TaxID=4212 RepID=A0AAD5GH16_AMBAR|nr:hypothetical protein M8C21_026373 [Ambrosia artemisiifolia]